MAEELITCRDAVRDLLDEITTYEIVHTREPDNIRTRCEVAVLMDSGMHGQGGWSISMGQHKFLLRSYLPLGAYPDGAENTICELWDLLRDKFNSHVTLDSTASRSNLESYNTGYLLISGVKCRILDVVLEVTLALSEAYE